MLGPGHISLRAATQLNPCVCGQLDCFCHGAKCARPPPSECPLTCISQVFLCNGFPWKLTIWNSNNTQTIFCNNMPMIFMIIQPLESLKTLVVKLRNIWKLCSVIHNMSSCICVPGISKVIPTVSAIWLYDICVFFSKRNILQECWLTCICSNEQKSANHPPVLFILLFLSLSLAKRHRSFDVALPLSEASSSPAQIDIFDALIETTACLATWSATHTPD